MNDNPLYAFSNEEEEEEDTPEFSLGGPVTQKLLPDRVIEARATKGSIATGQPVEDVRQKLSTETGESLFREEIQRMSDIEFHKQKLDMLNTVSQDGTPMTKDKADFILALSKEDIATNKIDYNEMEKRYAENAYRLLYANSTNENLDTSAKGQEKLDFVQSYTRSMEVFKKIYEDNNDWDETSVLGYAWNLGEQFVPYKSAYAKYDKNASGWLSGANLESQLQTLWLMEPQAREAAFKTRYEEIKASNPLDAQEWAQAVISYSQQDSVLDSAFNLIDATSLPVGKLLKGGLKTAKVGEKMASELGPLQKVFAKGPQELGPMQQTFAAGPRDAGLKATAKALQSTDPVKVLANSGNVEQAAELTVRQELQEVTGSVARGDYVAQVDNKLNSLYNPKAWLGDSRNLSGEAARRLSEASLGVRGTLRDIFANPTQALRYTPEALEAGFNKTKNMLRNMYVNANDSIIDTRWKLIRQEDTEAQVNEVVMALGDTNALPFLSPEDAMQAADHLYKIPDKGYRIENVGKGYVVEVTAPVDETDPDFTKLLLTDNVTPKSIANTFLSMLRSPEDLLSPMSRRNRNVVTPLAQETARIFEQAVAPTMTKLTKKQEARLDSLMKVNRDFQKGSERGKWFDTVAEYEQTYHDLNKEWPTEAEIAAYMTVREVSDFDMVVRSLTIARDMKAQGIMTVRHKFSQETLQEIKQNADDATDVELLYGINDHDVKFNGKLVDSLPENAVGDNPGVFLLKEGPAATSEWNLLSNINRKEIDRLVKEEGYRIYQTADPMDRPFSMLKDGDQAANFVIIKGGNIRSVDVTEVLPYKAGFHVEHSPGFWTKMPMFFRDKSGRMLYGGDKSILKHTTEAEAKKYTKAFAEAAKLYEARDMDGLKTFLRANLPHTVKDFVGIYRKSKITPDTPVFYTKSGQSTKDASRGHMGMYADAFKNTTDLSESKYNLMGSVNSKFAQEKNIELPSVVEGSEGNPIFKFNSSRSVSPLSTMHRAMHQLIRMNVYDNYQKQALSTFIEEFGNPNTLGGSVTKRSLDSIRKNPIGFLTDPLWDKNALDKGKLAAAKNSHRALVNLLGMPSDLQRNLDWVNQKVLDSVFERFGSDAAEKVSDFAHTKITDPAKYARSIAFHAKLGLFNPIQMFLQGNGIFHAAALTGNPARSMRAGAGSSFMRMLSLTDNENVIKGFAKKASFFGWKEDDFVESFKIMRETGVWNVEGDVAALDDVFSQKIYTKGVSKFLDKGTIFFKEIERFVRLNAWNTAYLEWKAANPGKKLSDSMLEKSKVLTRYDDLALNMTRKSTAAFQQGILSLPTQFSTYQLHLMEQLLGKRLTRAEKARATVTYAALYGLPVSIGAWAPLWPWGEDIRQAALERGIDINEGAMDVLMNGLMANALEMVTGKETNVGERYGPGGLSFIKDAVTGDKSLMELAFGPAGSVTADLVGGVFDTVAPVLGALRAGDPSLGNESYPLLQEDILQRLRTISSVNNATKFYVAVNYQKFISKNETFQMDADAMDGVLAGLFGIDPRAIGEAYVKLESIKEIKEFKQKKMQDVSKNMKRAAENYKNTDEWNRYMKAVRMDAIEGGLTPQEYMRAQKDAVRGMGTSFIEGINESFIRSAPANLQWKRRQEVNEQKEVQ